MDYNQLLKKHKLKELDFVELEAKGQTFRGKLLPSHEKSILSLKLENGYNVGIALNEIKRIEKTSEMKKPKEHQRAEGKSFEQNSSLPKIAILHTGGTIASRIDYETGAVKAAISPEALLELVPELKGIANTEYKMLANIMSEDIRFVLYKKIARAIEKEAKNGAQAVILTHGTDTLHYTAAALAFMLEGCNIPVLLVGSQRSSDRGSSDAAMNLVCAALFATKTDFAGVAICMHDSTADEKCAILPACKTRKMHSSRRDAFKAVNDIPIARVNYKSGEIEFLKDDYLRKSGKKMLVKDKMEERVALLKLYPNMFPEQFAFYKLKKYKGLVLEGTGLGHAPIGTRLPETKLHEKNLNAIKELVKSGCVVAMATQALFGRVQMNVYNNGRILLEAGVLPAEDMLPETAFIKLSWLLGNFGKKKAMELFGKNLRGEISEGTKIEEFQV